MEAALTGFAALVVVLMLCISLQVLCSLLDINPIATFEAELPLLGKAITLNSLLDFQWHLLAIVALLPAGIVWLRDGHVRVDFIYSKQSVRRKAIIELTGHIFLTAPFLFLCIPASWSFMQSAWRSDQRSPNDGLNDLWLIKATLPFGLSLLAIILVYDILRQAKRL